VREAKRRAEFGAQHRIGGQVVEARENALSRYSEDASQHRLEEVRVALQSGRQEGTIELQDLTRIPMGVRRVHRRVVLVDEDDDAFPMAAMQVPRHSKERVLVEHRVRRPIQDLPVARRFERAQDAFIQETSMLVEEILDLQLDPRPEALEATVLE